MVGWSLAGGSGTGGWLLAKHWEIGEDSTAKVGSDTSQGANQHTERPSPTFKKHTKLINPHNTQTTEYQKQLETPIKRP